MAMIKKKYITNSANNTILLKNKSRSVDKVGKFAEEIINTVREPLLVLDKDLRVLKASRSFFDFFKVNSDETIGTLIYDLGNHQWNIPKLRELLETILPEKTTFDNFEVEHDFSTIGKRIMLLNARKIERGPGKEQKILLAFEDITERKLVEKSLSETSRITNEYLDILFNHANVPIIIWDASRVITRINNAFEKLSGYDWTEIIDKKIDIFFPKDKIGSTLELIKKTINNEKLEVLEIDILTKDNDIRTVLWNSANIFDKEGKNIVGTIAQDITNRKRTEDALTVLETRYRRLFESTKDGVLILDAGNGKIIDVNPFLIEMLGYSKEQFIEKAIWEIGFFKDIAANEKIFFELQQKEYARYDNLPLETADGRKINVEFVSNVYLVNHHKVIQCHIRDITERKRTEEKLRESEEKFSKAFHTSPYGITITCAEDGRFLEANEAFTSITGFTREEVLSDSSISLKLWIDPEDRKRLTSVLLEGNEVKNKEFQFKLRNGDIIDGLLSAQILQLNNKVCILSSIADITDRKRSEEKLRESEERFRKLYENAKIGLYRTTPNGTILLANKALVKMLGYPSLDMLAERNLEKGCFEPSYHRKEFLEKIEKDGEVNNYESAWVCLDGSVLFVRESAKAIRDSRGNIQYFDGVVEDITGRKHAEEEIIMLANALKSVIECVSITDMEDKIIFVNNSFLTTYGFREDELIGKQITLVRSPKTTSKLVKEILQNTLSGGWQGELLNKRKNGSEFPIFLSTSMILDKNEKPIALIGVATDITERKNIEKELIDAKENAEQSDKLKSEFLAQMSHEIRTPLNAILGNVAYLDDLFNNRLDSDSNDCFDSIDIASKRIIRTIDLILNAAELQTKGYKPHFIKLDLDSEILEKLCQEYQRSAKQKGLELIYICEVNEASILVDEYSITQIFINLIDNAIKYTKKGKVEILLSKNKTGNIIVEVKDTGIGISKEFLQKIFEPFTQEEQGYTRSFDGNGLGLALVKNYCDINNVIIEVESKKNIGSIFRIIF